MTDSTGGTPKGEKLLAKLALGYSISAACRAERIGRTTYYRWRKEDLDLAALCDDAIETGTDLLEDKARDRAVKQSDTLIIFLLKARRREKYGDRSIHEVSGPNGEPLTILLGERSDGPS